MTVALPEWLRWAKPQPVLFEFLTIVTGVLVALGVDEWRDARDQHALELQCAARLRGDLQRDTARFGEFERVALARKSGTLVALLDAGSAPPKLGNPQTIITSLNYSTFLALPEAQSAVFREMESTGNLGLLHDPAIRTGFANLYAWHDLLSGILARPIGGYRELVAESLPGDVWLQWTAGVAPDSTALDHGLRALTHAAGFRAAVNAELMYAATMRFYLRQSRANADSLLIQLNAAYPR